MTLNLLDWDEDLQTDSAEEYQALLNGLRRSQGFGLFFVQCSPFSGGKLIERLQSDITDKKIAVLKLDKPIIDGNVFKRIQTFLAEHSPVEILIIQGLENSLFDAEETKKRLGWSGEKVNTYTWREVPPVLINLNQQRERFRDSFPICFVFLLPQYAIKYLIHRAPDFFDWRSGLVNYASDAQTLAQESQRILDESDYDAYQTWSEEERKVRLFDIQTWVDELEIYPSIKALLCFEQGLIFYAAEDFSAAVLCFDKVTTLKSDDHTALWFKGTALYRLGDKTAAITCYDQVLAIKPDDYAALWSKGDTLYALGDKTAAITCYDQVLAIKPDDYATLWSKGNTLYELGNHAEAIACYDTVLDLKPDHYEVLNNKGIVLGNLGQYEAAIACYNNALAIQPDYHKALSNKGNTLFVLGRCKEAIACCDQSLAVKPNHYSAWSIRGLALASLGQFEEALSSYDKALSIQPNRIYTIYKKSCCYSLQGDVDNAIQFLKTVIDSEPEYRDMAKTDTDFDPIHHDERFRALVEGE